LTVSRHLDMAEKIYNAPGGELEFIWRLWR
jgi:hypothetical protein